MVESTELLHEKDDGLSVASYTDELPMTDGGATKAERESTPHLGGASSGNAMKRPTARQCGCSGRSQEVL